MKLRIRDIGPHADTSIDINPAAVTTVSGPSRAGKSTILHAISFALWGQDSSGAKLDVQISSATPAASFDGFGRRGTARAISVDGDTQPGGTEEQFRAALPAHYRDPECSGLVMFPLRWVGLLDGPGEGRALRAALDRMLPGPTALDLLADLPSAASRDEKGAAALVTSLRSAAKTARGRAQGLRDAVPTTPPPAGPTDEQVTAARSSIAAAADARADLAAWQVEQAKHAAAAAAIVDWQRRRDAIVEPSEPRAQVTQAMVDAAEAEQAAIRQHNAASAAYQSALSSCADARNRAAEWDRRAAGLIEPAQPGPTVAEIDAAREAIAAYDAQSRAPCPPKPSRPRDWVAEPTASACPGAKGCQIGDRARAEADRVNAEHAAAWSTWLAWDAAQISDPVGARDIMRRAQEWAQFNARTSDLGRRPEVPPAPEPVPPLHIGQARSTLNHARNISAAWASYDDRIAAIGLCPDAPPDLRPRPEVPDLADADEVVTSAARAAQRLADHNTAVTAAEAKAITAEEDAATAEQLLAAADGWLLAVRSAPARALAGKLALLGDGAMRVLDDNGKTRVEINGRPWYLASHGERVAADAGFRLRLRAAAGLDVLPVFVDDVSSVGGIEIPTAPGVVLLVTTTDGDLTVTERAA